MWKSYFRQVGGQPESVSQSQTAAQGSKAMRINYYKCLFRNRGCEIDQVSLHRLKRTQSLPDLKEIYMAAKLGHGCESESSQFDGYITEPSGIPLVRTKKHSKRALLMERRKQILVQKRCSRCFTTSSIGTVQWQTKYLNGRKSCHSIWADDTSKYDDSISAINKNDDHHLSFAYKNAQSQTKSQTQSRKPLFSIEAAKPLQNIGPEKDICKLQRLFCFSHCENDDSSPFDALDSCNTAISHNSDYRTSRRKWWRGLKNKDPNKTMSPTADRHGLRPWTAQEDQELRKYVDQNCVADQVDWEKVGLRFGRSGVGCMSRYYLLK